MTVVLFKNSHVFFGSLFLFFLALLAFLPAKPPQSTLPNQLIGFNQVLGSQNSEGINLPKVVAPPYLVDNPLPFPTISATSYEIYDRESRMEILGLNKHQKIATASLTKLLTAIVGLKNLRLDDVGEVKEPVINGSNMGLKDLEKVSFENLLWGLLLPSGNDAAYAIAQAAGAIIGNNNDPKISEQAFITAMNTEAQFLNLFESHFANPAGLDEIDHSNFSTAFDLARLGDYAVRFPIIASIVQTPTATVFSTDQKTSHQLINTNDLLDKIQGVIGIKTGTTPASGQSIILNVNRNGHEVIFVILGSKDRDSDARQLIEWMFKNYRW
ncbi:MAG: hypothetical protein UT37_C0009G0024 [Parcubacteria group bacterium GW2011_GWA2_39_18]|nr:MAG: hypothetical protein UT37_C0009G0024 [Parcubacteria group bacterium GW2011_GWA2_39_18]